MKDLLRQRRTSFFFLFLCISYLEQRASLPKASACPAGFRKRESGQMGKYQLVRMLLRMIALLYNSHSSPVIPANRCIYRGARASYFPVRLHGSGSTGFVPIFSAQVKGGRDVPINNYGLLSEESRALRAVSGSFLLNGDNQSNDMTPSGSRDPKKVSFFLPTSEDLGGYERLYSSPSVNAFVRRPSCTSSLN